MLTKKKVLQNNNFKNIFTRPAIKFVGLGIDIVSEIYAIKKT